VTHPTPKPPRRRDPKSTRERLVRSALDLFTSKGYHETTTPQIAARAGVAEGTIYRHFASKDLLLNELYRAGVRRLLKPVVESKGGTRDRLEAIAADWRELALRDASLARMVFDGRFTQLLDERSRTAWAELGAALESMVASGKSAGEVRAGGAGAWADFWVAVVRHVVLKVADGRWKPDDPAVRLMLDGVWRAMSAAPDALQTPANL
jgi:AcrR family transcriptional regulator